jgi:hypothetical protein
MDYNTVTEDIIRLTDDLNTWSSTLCIPVKDSESLLDISSAANDADSCVPEKVQFELVEIELTSKSNTFNLMLSRLNAIKKIQFDYIQIQ